MINWKRKKLKGSVLVFSLLVLFIMLSLTLTAVMLVIFSKGSSRSTEKSIIAFQIADGAAENMLQRLYQGEPDATLDDFTDSLFGTGPNGTGKPTCYGGVISGQLPLSSGTYAVTFLESDNKKLQCNGTGYDDYCTWRKKLSHIVANGTYSGVTRAIDVSVELPSDALCP